MLAYTVLGVWLFLIGRCSCLYAPLSLGEQQRITIQLQQKQNDLKSIYYAVTSLNAIGKEPAFADHYCSTVFQLFNSKLIVDIFQVSEISKILKCKNVPIIAISELLNEDSDAVAYSRAIVSMVNLGYPVPSEAIHKLVKIGKENDSPANAAILFYAASLLPKSDVLNPIVSMVEDVLAQADEVNNEYLQFEGGLALTSQIVRGIISLGDQQGKSLMKVDQVNKFANYFLNRKYVYLLKDIHHLTSALLSLSNNKHQVPLVVSVFNTDVISKENPLLKVRITNLLDVSLNNVQVNVKSFVTADERIIFDNQAFVKSPEKDDYIIVEGEVARGYFPANSYNVDVGSTNPLRGMYKCNVQVNIGNQKHYIVKDTYVINVKVVSKIAVEDVFIEVGEKDQASKKHESQLVYPNKLSSVLEADYHQTLLIKFNLKEINSGQSVVVHQAFVRLVHELTGQEIFFVSEPDSADNYKFTLDVGATAKDSFNNLSGKYKMSLIVGDSTVQVPICWSMGEIVLNFAGQPKKSKRQERIVSPKPVIEHMFRVPETRPPAVVSSAFTVLALSPFLVMFAMWYKVGANLSNFQFSFPALLFHVGLAGVFALYYMFWLQLNMFQTLKGLAIVGGLTFLGGNRLLANMAASKYRT
ncbi:dolichyl-diphosphooligosaccharide--protein glycosyltransferase subunit 2 isoform X3 [Hydra vulgaris]|uniref:Dolichyl-diphosphooligosaccharide--protein glycosyltransferase subunit 2 n=2 Tax=Hydra vulgaris TaxID=6087 RepID=A0ABM4BR52_HYDVU